jgi:hypothetical protein
MSIAASLRMMREINARAEQSAGAQSSVMQIREAADFVTGAEAGFARAADRRGSVLETWRQAPDEPRGAFLERARAEAADLHAARLLVGGVPRLEDENVGDGAQMPRPASLSRETIIMPDGALHAGQIAALKVIQANRFSALCAGRRFGKSSLAAALAADVALLGGMAGLFAPIYKLSSPLFDILAMALAPLIASSNRSFGELRLVGGGGIDIWTLEHPRAGRGRRYDLVVLDEAAFAGPDLTTIWSASIRPTLADTMGPAIVASTPSGVAEDNFFWRVCHEPSYGFVQFTAPTRDNPFIPPLEIEALRAQHNPLIFSQEFEARFVNLAGVGLFDVAKMLNKGEPWETPPLFDIVYACLDSGVKGGQEHDASAVVYVGLNAAFAPLGLYVLDWEAVEVGAGSIELWFAGVGRTLNEYAKHARQGSRGVHVEAAGLGELLLAKAGSLGVRAQEIDPKHVSRGKDLRALSVEGLINGGKVRLTKPACDRMTRLKGVVRNHLLYQITSFRIADKDAWKRSDDLIDALVYAALVAYRSD